MIFIRWLESQSERGDAVGAFARAVQADRRRPSSDVYGRWTSYLRRTGLGAEVRAMFKTAWREWSRAEEEAGKAWKLEQLSFL